MLRDVGVAEDLAQDALVAALEKWPQSGIPDNPGAWLMTAAKHRAIDLMRRSKRLEDKYAEIGFFMAVSAQEEVGSDDLLSLIFTCCHPVLSRDARVALTLRMLGGLSTPEIARAFLVPELHGRAADRARQEGAGGPALRGPRRRRNGAATGRGAGGRLPDLQRGLCGHRGRGLDAPFAVRGRAAPRPRAVVAGAARERGLGPAVADGDPGLADDRAGDARRFADPPARPGSVALEPAADQPRALGARRAESLGLGPYGLQAAIAACHARAHTARGDGLDPDRRALLDARRRRALAGRGAQPRGRARHRLRARQRGSSTSTRCATTRRSPPTTCCRASRGDLLVKLGRTDEARAEFERAAALTDNAREKALLLARSRALATRA